MVKSWELTGEGRLRLVAAPGSQPVGRPVNAHATFRRVHGEVKVRPETDEPDARLGTAGRRLIGGRVGVSAHRAAPKPLTLLTGSEVLFKGMPGWIMRFAEVEVSDRSSAHTQGPGQVEVD